MKKSELKEKIVEAWKEVYALYDKNVELEEEVERLKLELETEKAKEKEIVYVPYTLPYTPYIQNPYYPPQITYELVTVNNTNSTVGRPIKMGAL